ncbi:hypothetical protein FB451DRAFT_735883 [Mycena latifolia]|nr:hypothetical protein FB451DRAFT_735883 [Mycena latifolia]
MAAETVLSVQELCDHIADHIALQPSSCDVLKSAALVCQTLCISTQSHIFRHVILPPSHRGIMSNEESGRKADASASRCIAILRASPRLSRYVHHLTILARPEILKSVLDARFPYLRKLSFNFNRNWLPVDQSGLIRDCIALPSIREVELADLGICLTDLHFVASFFDNCSSQLHSLAFVDFSATNVPATHPATHPAMRPAERRLRIQRLQLYIADLGDWFTSPSCPFDFGHLTEFATNRDTDTALQVLASARLSLTRLRTRGNYLNLFELPTLTCLEFSEFWRDSLTSLNPDNCVERLIVHVPIPVWFDGQSNWLLFMDTIIATSPMPALQRVEVLIHCGPDFDVEQVKPCFPKLLGRGLLRLTHDAAYAS